MASSARFHTAQVLVNAVASAAAPSVAANGSVLLLVSAGAVQSRNGNIDQP